MDFTSSQLRTFITESNSQGAISNTKKVQSYLTPARSTNSSAKESGGAISVTKSLQPYIAAAHSTNSSVTKSGGTISETKTPGPRVSSRMWWLVLAVSPAPLVSLKSHKTDAYVSL